MIKKGKDAPLEYLFVARNRLLIFLKDQMAIPFEGFVLQCVLDHKLL
jgi:hypothetical protein